MGLYCTSLGLSTIFVPLRAALNPPLSGRTHCFGVVPARVRQSRKASFPELVLRSSVDRLYPSDECSDSSVKSNWRNTLPTREDSNSRFFRLRKDHQENVVTLEKKYPPRNVSVRCCGVVL